MFDIDKELRELNKDKYTPKESLRIDTREKVIKEIQSKGDHRRVSGRTAIKVFASVAVAIALLVAFSFNVAPTAEAAGYYTIDINPSISITVDKNNKVISVTSQNSDASAMLSGVDLKGMDFEDALKTVIETAVRESYLKDNGNILVAHFGEGVGITQQELDSIVVGENAKNVNVLVLNGGKDDYTKSEKSGVSAGIKLLLKEAKAMGIDDQDISTVISKVHGKEKNGDQGNVKDKGNSDNVKATDNNIKPDNQGNGGGKDNKDSNANSDGKNAKPTASDNGKNGKGNGNKDSGKDKDKK